MKLQRTIVYEKSIELYIKARRESKKKKSKKETINYNHYEYLDLNEVEDFVPSSFTITTKNVFHGLSNRGRLLLTRIIDELEWGNALWYFDHTENSRNSTVIKELREKGILLKTDNTCIHFVNPFFIRTGQTAQILAKMVRLTYNCSHITREMIKPLRYRGRIEFDPIDISNAR